MSAHKGDLVQIHMVVLEPGERSANLPAVTRAVPYEGWLKGFLLDGQAEIGQAVRIRTLAGREVTGVMSDVNPRYDHDFGEALPEVECIGLDAWDLLEGAE